MVVVAIIGTATLFAVPTIKDWQVRNSLDESINNIYSSLVEAKQVAFAKNTTSRMLVTRSGSSYTINVYSLPTPSSACNAALGTWVTLKTQTLKLNGNFNITGSGIGNICFYRDGSSSGGAFAFRETTGQAIYNMSADIAVIIATGFIDLVRN